MRAFIVKVMGMDDYTIIGAMVGFFFSPLSKDRMIKHGMDS